MDPTKISDQGKIDDFENFEYSEILHILMGCTSATAQWRDTKRGNILEIIYTLLGCTFGLYGCYSKVIPEFLVSKLGFRGLCKASKTSNWSKPENTLGDLTQNFPTFSKPILNSDFYIKTDPGST